MESTIGEFFTALPQKVSPSRIAGLNATLQFLISGDHGGQWRLVFADGKLSVDQDEAESPDLTVITSDADWRDLVEGKLSGTAAMATGKVRFEGDVTLAVKLQALL